MTTKHCPSCERDLPLKSFGKASGRKSGLQPYCRECRAARDAARKVELNAYHRQYRATETYRQWREKWEKENRPRLLAQRKQGRDQLRLAALDHYGKKCACCGESTLVFLAIDHINGGGTKQRKETGRSSSGFYYWLRKNGYPKGFQTLCHNCNWAKHLLGKCPHHA